MTRREVIDTVEQLQPATVGPAVRLRRSPLAGEPAPPEVVKAELGGMLAIRRAGLPPSLLERRERLEQLRALEAGLRIDVAFGDTMPLGVDTPADLDRARQMTRHRSGPGAR